MKTIVKIKHLNEGAVAPFKTYSKDMCYDVVAVSEEEVAPNVWKYGLGFACEMSLPEYDTDKCVWVADGSDCASFRTFTNACLAVPTILYR